MTAERRRPRRPSKMRDGLNYGARFDGKNELTIDHLAYLKDRHHRREVHLGLRRIARKPGGVYHITTLHEHDDSCCEIQPWIETALRIRRALADDGEKVMYALCAQPNQDAFLLFDHEGETA